MEPIKWHGETSTHHISGRGLGVNHYAHSGPCRFSLECNWVILDTGDDGRCYWCRKADANIERMRESVRSS